MVLWKHVTVKYCAAQMAIQVQCITTTSVETTRIWSLGSLKLFNVRSTVTVLASTFISSLITLIHFHYWGQFFYFFLDCLLSSLPWLLSVGSDLLVQFVHRRASVQERVALLQEQWPELQPILQPQDASSSNTAGAGCWSIQSIRIALPWTVQP